MTHQDLLLTVADVERVAGPAQHWKGRCFELASLLVKTKLVKGQAVYGHWVGPVARTSFFAQKRSIGFVQHGWVLLKDGETVVDPTRWVFEDKEPYIFIGREKDTERCDDFVPDDEGLVCQTCGHVDSEHARGSFFQPCRLCHWPYDEGGNQLRERAHRVPPPPAETDEKKFRVLEHLKPDDLALVRAMFKPVCLQAKQRLTFAQAHWLATQPYACYGEAALRIYTALRLAGAEALIPIDNMRRAEREGVMT